MKLLRLGLVDEAESVVFINPKRILAVTAGGGKTCHVTLDVVIDPDNPYRGSRLMSYHVNESAKSLLKRLRKI